MSGRKDRDAKRANARYLHNRYYLTPCPHCGKFGAHFVPPSLGEPGYWLCAGPTQDECDKRMRQEVDR